MEEGSVIIGRGPAKADRLSADLPGLIPKAIPPGFRVLFPSWQLSGSGEFFLRAGSSPVFLSPFPVLGLEKEGNFQRNICGGVKEIERRGNRWYSFNRIHSLQGRNCNVSFSN